MISLLKIKMSSTLSLLLILVHAGLSIKYMYYPPFSPLVCLLVTHWCYWIDHLSSCLLVLEEHSLLKNIWFASVAFGYKTVAFNNYHSPNFNNKWLKCIFVAGLGINTDFPIQSDSNSFESIIDIISYNLFLGTYGKNDLC